MAVLATIQLSMWCVLWRIGLSGTPLIGLYDIVAFTGIFGALIPFFLTYLWRIRREGEKRPLVRIRHDFDPKRASSVVVALLLGGITGGAFSALKTAIPLVVPFYLDPKLSAFERGVFGTDPWRVTHELLSWATPLIDRFYLSWLPVMLIAFNLVLLSKPSAFKTKSLLTYILIWPVVGVVGAYLFSSAGPIFHDAIFGGNSGLLSDLRREGANGTLFAYHHLWSSYANRYETLAGGISAMPSMHISMACWLALSVGARFPRFSWAGWLYFGLIWLSSIHLGWHYFSDGLVGTVITLLVWQASGAVVRRRQTQELRLATAGVRFSLAPRQGPLRGVTNTIDKMHAREMVFGPEYTS